ncbi:MAG: SprT family zinc-dependent metalloprotease [Gemmatimonadota bacterium]
MIMQLHLGSLSVDVVRKPIKNVHLSVHPPSGRVRISAPSSMKPETIRLFAISRLGWIKQQQRKLQGQEREPAREYLDRESHYLWGRRYLLEVRETETRPSVELQHNRMVLSIRPGSRSDRRQEVLEAWYRSQVKSAVPPLLDRWQRLIGVEVERFFVRRMKTKWGSCNHCTGTIRLNTELAKKPHDCLEYIVVHELAHLLEPTHNEHFTSLMDAFMPAWRDYRRALNQLPVPREDWKY